MPELPEVEIVRQSLDKKIKAKRVKKVIVRNKNLRFKIPSNFNSFMKNKKIIKVDRFSKYLILHLSNKRYCLLHLGMSGRLKIIKIKIPTIKHDHLVFKLRKYQLVFNDPRKFGFVDIIESDNIYNIRYIKK